MDFIIIIDFERARKRYEFLQAKRPTLYNMLVSRCDGLTELNLLDSDLIVGLFSIPKKGLVWYYEQSRPDSWLQAFPVNIGACPRYGCPQIYHAFYFESLSSSMDGQTAGDIV